MKGLRKPQLEKILSFILNNQPIISIATERRLSDLLQLRKTSKEELWRYDLKEFLAKLDEVEQKEREDAVVREQGSILGKPG